MQNIRIDTAQNVGIDYELASIGDRIVASLIDSIAIKGGYIGIWIALFRTVDGVRSLFNETAYVFLIFLPLFFYDVVMEIFNDGQSLGKRFMHLKVVMLDGSQPAIGSYLLRWLFRLVEMDTAAGSIALWSYLFSQRGQRLGDLAAGTTVVKLKDHALAETIFENIDINYQPVFSQSALLSDAEAAIIRDILTAFETPHARRENFEAIADETQKRLSARLGIRTDMPALPFLQTLIRDYNSVHGAPRVV